MRVPAPSIDDSLCLKLLPAFLSLVAGSADAIGFLGLQGLFVAHITGNLIVLAAHLVTGTPVSLSVLLSVPVFIVVLGVTRIFVAGLEAAGIAPLRPLLLLQFLFLAGFLSLGVYAGPRLDPDAAVGTLAGMLGVCALAAQNGLVQISLRGSPSTAVMTTNITRFMMDFGEVVFGHGSREVEAARRRAVATWPAIVGFAVGAASGAALFAAAGLSSLALPTGLALVTLGGTYTNRKGAGIRPHDAGTS